MPPKQHLLLKRPGISLALLLVPESIRFWIRRNLVSVFGFIRQSEAVLNYRRSLKIGLLRVGRHTYGYPRIISYPNEQGIVEIGNYCSIANDVTIILSGRHRWWVTSYPMGDLYYRPEIMQYYNSKNSNTCIGSDVWIGYGATILGGVQIGDGAVIGAYAVVDKNVPPYAVVAGNRAQIIGYRFEHEEIDMLLKVCWWEWDDQQVKDALLLLSSMDPVPFLYKYANYCK